MNLSKRLALLGAQSALSIARPRGLGSSSSSAYGLIDRRPFQFRQISELTKVNGKRAFLVDTLALVTVTLDLKAKAEYLEECLICFFCCCWKVRSLEAQGVPSKQAEAITSAITEVLNDSLENVSESFVSKAEMQKVLGLLFSMQSSISLKKKNWNFSFFVLFWSYLVCLCGCRLKWFKILISPNLNLKSKALR